MYSCSNSILLLCITISIVLLWCTVQPSYADTNEQHMADATDEDNSAGNDVDQIDDILDLYRRASLRPFAGKRASLRPVVVHQRASLRPFAGKRASLRPTSFAGAGKRKRRSIALYDD